MTLRSRDRGFSLIEILVATLIFAIVFLGVLRMLDSSTKISKLESALADTQENVRYAAYHLVRIARMAGGSNLPLARNDTGFHWVSLEVLDNNGGTTFTSFTDDFGGSHDVLADSDVLRIRGFFESTPYFIQPGDVDLSSGRVSVYETTPSGHKIQDFDHVPRAGKGLVLMGRNQYAIGKVSSVSMTAASGPGAHDRVMTINFTTGDGGLWQSLNPNGTWVQPTFQIYRVGVLDSYNYFVGPDLQLRRWRASAANSGNGTVEPVAINIGSLQIALGLDISGDGILQTNEWYFSDTNSGGPSQADAADPEKPPLALRISVLGRTPFPISGWVEPATTFNIENMTAPTGDPRRSKWRVLRVEAALRDFVL